MRDRLHFSIFLITLGFLFSNMAFAGNKRCILSKNAKEALEVSGTGIYCHHDQECLNSVVVKANADGDGAKVFASQVNTAQGGWGGITCIILKAQD